jgi:hypothetical protein
MIELLSHSEDVLRSRLLREHLSKSANEWAQSRLWHFRYQPKILNLSLAVRIAQSSHAGESHPRVLTELNVNVSAHPALAIEPPTDAATASEQTGLCHGLPSPQSSVPPASDAASGRLTALLYPK